MNTFTKVAVAAGLAVTLSSVAFAGGYSRVEAAAMPMHQEGVSGLGFTVASPFDSTQGVSDYLRNVRFGLAYVMNPWEMGIHFRGDQFNTNDTHNYNVEAFAGWRAPLYHALFGSVGARFAWNNTNRDILGLRQATVNTYTPGAYLGMSWEPNEHIQVFGRLHAVSYSWTHTAGVTSKGNWSFFNGGEFGLGFFFGNVL
jgi:hypothetical protein